MLSIHVDDATYYNEDTETFAHVKGADLQLEHSLISLSRWEEKWHIPFLATDNKTDEQIRDYVRCMTVTKNIDQQVYDYMPTSVLKEILDYIENPMTATWFNDENEKRKGAPRRKEIVTSEIIYYWMITLNIPVQFERWHLNRLLTLIRVLNIKNAPSKKMNKRDILANNRKLNAARRAKHKSKG